jgi:hypothetical protein
MQRRVATSRDTFVSLCESSHSASPLGHSRWLLAHWSEPRLMSVAARRAWLEPDLAPLAYRPLAPGLVTG